MSVICKGKTLKKSWLKFEGRKAKAADPGSSPCTEHYIFLINSSVSAGAFTVK